MQKKQRKVEKKKKGKLGKKMKKCKNKERGMILVWGNNDSPTPFSVMYQLHDPGDAAGQFFFFLHKNIKKS